MNYFKSIIYVIAADILSLFIGLTLASSSSTLIRLISAVCTISILICLVASFGLKTARENLKSDRINKTKTNPMLPVTVGLTASLPAAISWVLLYISHSTGKFDYYRIHKLICGYFLQIFNFINSDASTVALSDSQVMLMLPLIIVPCLAYIIPYMLMYKGIIPES